ncbi:MAG TPA: DNA polymerase III subunit beta [Candidatus Limnocylindria bacterium]|jgi:DNA polymerase-3 subunit beta|nr:DNA polymerase III subunit beta [Candidatus Limnocylindria bacterium]
MNVSVMQENLVRGLQTVSRAVSTRATLPVLANVLLKTENSGIKLTATNLEIGINCWVPGKVTEEGEITVPARLLTDLVASLPNQRIDLVLSPKDRTLKLTCGSNRSSIKGIEADEFPVVAAIGESPATSVDARVLREALGEVVFAAATDESRPILTGVLTRLAGDTMTLAAADNYRIAVRTVKLDRPVSPDVTIVVPGRSYQELMRIMPDAEQPIEITVTPNKSQVLFHVDGIDLVSRLIEGQFPNYEPVIPTSHTSRAVLDREAFLSGTRRASIFARDSANIVKIELGGDGAEGEVIGVSITAHAADVGDNADTVEASVEGSPTTIAFNARYLLDVLSNLGSEEAALELSGPLAPGVIRGIGKDDYVHVIMPVRTAS